MKVTKITNVITQSGHLRRHFKVNHQNNKIHKCQNCKKTFATKYHLKRHLKVHTNI